LRSATILSQGFTEKIDSEVISDCIKVMSSHEFIIKGIGVDIIVD